MINELEDEEVSLKNSPLTQYLESLNLNDVEEKITTSRKKNFFKIHISYILNCFVINIIPTIQTFIKRKLLENHISVILNYINKANILKEIDEMYLNYLINSQSLNSNYERNKTFPVSTKKKRLYLVGIISIFPITYFMGKCVVFFTATLILILCLSLFMVYALLIRWLLSIACHRLILISEKSRKVILLIQELLSLNQGYLKLVHLKNNTSYDCSKSFNNDFLRNFSCEVFQTLSDLLSLMRVVNEKLLKYLMESNSTLPNEVPWFSVREEISDDYENQEKLELDSNVDLGKLNTKEPISQLKTVHNLVQIKFSDFIKMVVILVYDVRNHPDLFLIAQVAGILHEFTSIIQRLTRCSKIIHMKTDSNLCERKKNNGFHLSNLSCLTNTIQTVQLQLFELSEFSVQFLEAINEIQNLTHLSFTEWLQSQRYPIEKARKHFDGLNLCWEKFEDIFEDIMNKNLLKKDIERDQKDNNEKWIKTGKGWSSSEQEQEDSKLIDDYPEIVDEVIEGISEDLIDDEDPSENGKNLTDPFEEKYSNNAKALLIELQSVIENRASDWKNREKLALKRREAQGKFVFTQEQRQNFIERNKDELNYQKNTKEMHSESLLEIESRESDLISHKSLAEMIVKQRHAMFIGFDDLIKDEECFGD